MSFFFSIFLQLSNEFPINNFQDLVFNPYALGCGHLFCKSCACSAASVMIFQGLKAATSESKCPVCREVNLPACL